MKKYKFIPTLMVVFIVAFALAVALQQALGAIRIGSDLDLGGTAKIINVAADSAASSVTTVDWVKQYISGSVTEVGNTSGDLDIESRGDVIIRIGP